MEKQEDSLEGKVICNESYVFVAVFLRRSVILHPDEQKEDGKWNRS